MRLKALKFTLLVSAIPALAFASGGGAANPWLDVAFKFVNFAALLAIFYFSLRKIIPQALADRRDTIAKDLK
ncbi:hypothetical protein FDZ71_06110, partial [bacterium]